MADDNNTYTELLATPGSSLMLTKTTVELAGSLHVHNRHIIAYGDTVA